MTNPPIASDWKLSPSQAVRVNRRCDDFYAGWKAGRRPQIEVLIKRC
jgi:hypothetical protein